VPTTGESGVVTVVPSATTVYTLRSVGSAAMSAQAEVKVHPVNVSFTANPPSAKTGEKVTLSWETRAATQVVVTEATFGELARPTGASEMASGFVEWTVPGGATADGGTAALPQGFPLRFVLSASTETPSFTVTRALDTYAGDAPKIVQFSAPAGVTTGKKVALSWKTANAVRVQIFADGLLVYEPVQAAVASGTVSLPLAQTTTFRLVAHGFTGASVSQSAIVKSVAAPKITAFTVPANVGTAGSSANVTWTTQDATRAEVRIKQGPTVWVTEVPAKVASGAAALFPAASLTYVLVAQNLAGEAVTSEKAVTVGTPVTLSATPSPTTPGTTVALSWDASVLNPVQMDGLPAAAPQSTLASTEFIEVENLPGVTGLVFDDPNDSVAVIGPGAGFRFPFIGSVRDSFWVSTNGFVSFAPTSSLPTNSDLAASNQVPPLVAPFWDDLELGTGTVKYAVESQAFPRRLIVQWTGVSIAGDPTSKLTFQVQLLETGAFRFVYGGLADANSMAQGQGATVGVQLAFTEFYGQHSYNAASVAEQQDLLWFSSPAASGTASMIARDTRIFSAFWLTGAGDYAAATLSLRVYGVGSIQVSEAMPTPNAAFPSGAWVELWNPQQVEVELTGLTLKSSGSTAAGFAFPEGTSIPAGGYLVVGESTDPLENGDAKVTLAWDSADLPLTAADTLSLLLPGTAPVTLSTLVYTGAVAGTSVQAKEKAIDSTGAPVTCARAKTFGVNGDLGTPGAMNETCFKYALIVRPVSYRDISATGTPLFVAGSMDLAVSTVDLAAAPFPYFGTGQSALRVSTNGFVAFKPALTSSYDTNKVLPTTSEPFGIASIFWDDLKGSLADANAFSKRIGAGEDPANPGAHWIIQWHHWSHYNAGDELNFQVKLFDTGVIEYHYASMVSGSTSNYADGNSATVWLDNPTGTEALPISIETASIQPNTAYVFMPQ
ncbi:MAG: lamin tail domain-containing protein, partial [Myxococcaceae bacterium]